MKRLYISILVCSLVVTACTDQLYQDTITSKDLSTFPKNEIELEEYINAVYGGLQASGLYGLYMPVLGEIPSDNTFDEVPANDDGMYGQLDEFSTATSNTIVSGTWRDSYQAIQKANVVLNRLPNITYKAESTKSARSGEMKFIRALLYFNLVRLYGAVPLALNETSNPNTYFGQGRTPATEVYAQIVKDLTEAIDELPANAANPGRVIITAAQTLLAKVYLTQDNAPAAKTLLDAVVASGKHTLMARPSDVFRIDNENNAEIIFAVQFASGINGNSEGSVMFQIFSPSGTQSGAKGHNLPTKSLYALYTADDLRKGAYVDVTPAAIPLSKKLTLPATVITDGGSDIVVLRYADVLLMLAEAENSLHNTTIAAGYLNDVRTRAGLDETTAVTEGELTDAIAFERRLEFVGEGHRWFDLVRTGKALTVMNQWFKDNGKAITIDDHNLLLPIPQGQRDTDPTIEQNDGYK